MGHHFFVRLTFFATIFICYSAEASAANLSAPASLAATTRSATEIDLHWVDPNTSERRQLIERSLDPVSEFVQIATVPRNRESYRDLSLASGATYYYRVRAVARTGEFSPYSNVVRVVPPLSGGGDVTAPSVPPGLTATAASCSQVNLSWGASTDTGGSGLAGYKVFRGGVQIGTTANTTYSNTGLTASTAYSFTVAAYDNAGNTSAQSTAAPATTPACSTFGTQMWSKNIGGPAAGDSAKVAAVAVDTNGNVVITGTFAGTIDLGNGPLRSTDDVDIFVGKYASNGAPLWVKQFGASSQDGVKNESNGIAVDGSGNVYITGTFYPTLDFGGGALVSSSSTDTFVVKFAADGTHVWSRNFPSLSGDSGKAIAVDPAGNVIVAGFLSGWVDFGGGVLRSAGSADIYVAKFSSAGAHIWSKIFGDLNPQFPKSIATDTHGNVLVTGYFQGTVDFGGGPLTSAMNPVSGLSNDAFLVKLSPDGAHLWSKSFGDLEGLEQQGYSVASDLSDNVVVTGYVVGTVDFGGGPLSQVGNQDVFIARYASSGQHLWSKRFGAAGNVDFIQYGTGVATDSGGNVTLTGYVRGPVDFGGGVLPTSDLSYISDAFIAQFQPDGSHRWSKRYGDSQSQYGRGVATDAGGNVLAIGEFLGSIDFGGGPSTTPGTVNTHVYLVKLSP